MLTAFICRQFFQKSFITDVWQGSKYTSWTFSFQHTSEKRTKKLPKKFKSFNTNWRRIIDLMMSRHYSIVFPAGTATLWHRCNNVAVDVVTTLWHGRKWELYWRQFLTLWQRRPPTLPRCCYNVATTWSTGFLSHFTTEDSDFFPFIETWESY